MKPSQRLFGFGIVLTFAFVLFLYIFGAPTLNPHHTNWLIEGDSEVFYYGFNFFNHEAWTHPLGKIISYSFPESSSIVYTDSIPWLALLGKIFGQGSVFQYFGIWVALCFLLQGGFAFLLLTETGIPFLTSILGSFFFLFLPTFLNRTYQDTKHYTLVGQFFVLIGIFLFTGEKRRKNLKFWLIAFGASLGVHLYLTFILGFFFLISFSIEELKALFRKKEFYFSIAGLGFLAYELGYFAIPVQNSTAGGFGFYAMNLAGPFDSYNRSLVLPALPHVVNYHEGYQYFGLGFIALLGITLFSSEKRKALGSSLKTTFQSHWEAWFALILLCTSFQIMFLDFKFMEWATFPILTAIYFYFRKKDGIHPARIFGEAALLFLAIFACGRIFRATGRFFWIPEYLLLYLLLRLKPHPALLAVLLGLQIADLSPLLNGIKSQQKSMAEQTIPASPDFGKDVDSFDHISIIGGYMITPASWMNFALEHGKTIGPLAAARGSSGFRKKEKEKIENDLMSLKPDKRTLYMVGNPAFWEKFEAQCRSNPDKCARLKTGFYDTYHYVYQP